MVWSVRLVVPDVLLGGGGGETEALVGRSPLLVPEGCGLLDTVPKPLRAVLTYGIPALSRRDGDLRAGAVPGEKEDCGLVIRPWVTSGSCHWAMNPKRP